MYAVSHHVGILIVPRLERSTLRNEDAKKRAGPSVPFGRYANEHSPHVNLEHSGKRQKRPDSPVAIVARSIDVVWKDRTMSPNHRATVRNYAL